MKKAERPIQYAIRGVPREIDAILRRKAVQRAQSLNQIILDELAVATGFRKPKADFSDLAGPWAPDPAFDEIAASRRQIDLEKWK